jgi:ketosteroid isomerase-like protein
MKTELPAPIDGFFQAHNSGSTENLLDLFASDAVVADENHEYRGEAIRAWLDDAIAKFRPLQAEVTRVEAVDGRTVAVAQVSGAFPGSPVELRYRFTLRDGKIAALNIGP